MSQKMVHMEILEKCGGDLEHSLRSRCIEPCSTEEYINALEDIVTRTKIQRKCHKCGGIGHLANNFVKKAKISETVAAEDHNDKEEESDSEKDTGESKTSESDEINIINAQINNINLIYEVLDVNSNLPQVGTSDTSLTNIKDAKLYRTKPEKGMGYTAGKSSTSIVMVENQDTKVNFDTGAYYTCFGKGYLKSIVPDLEENLYQYKESNLVVPVRA
ncbi:hypothetical protein O181_050792 [Austropuccinia psidii MF-1]|uniref:Uncharacterized protein n=1 Tax=Austropuccinia psidii MF-1 TaxID=1389203 RepID=A0A9Q3HNX3_9BASI|nr:hypothetical protein [Austropuccinia psidii MF-1]